MGATAVPASASSDGDGESRVDSNPFPHLPPYFQKTWIAGTALKVRANIELGPGKKTENTLTSVFDLVKDSKGKPLGMRVEWPWWADGVAASATYRLKLYGKDTAYWLKTRVYAHYAYTANAQGACEIYEGEPGAPGAEPTSMSPFECETHKHGLDNDFDFTVNVADELAEASGVITPTNVSLTEGMFHTDAKYRLHGSTEISAGGSTRFDAVLRGSDRPFYENQARTEWAYRIVDDEGGATGFWVAGLSTNYRGTVKFSADGRCAIYTSNPLHAGGRLDDTHPIEDADYICTTTGEMLHGPGEWDNRHFDATHIVSKK